MSIRVQAGRMRRHAAPYLILLTVALFCHGMLLLNQATIWDSWYVLSWLQTKHFAPMHDFFGSVGMPTYALLYQPFASFDQITTAFMIATFSCIFVGSLLTYHLAQRLTSLGRAEALAIAALALAIPVFNAAQDFIMFFFLFAYTLFLGSALLVVNSLERRGAVRWLGLAVGIVGFWQSFANAALLVFYGAFYVLLFFRFGRTAGASLIASGAGFIWRHPLLFILPPANWIARGWLTPQYGWYAHYNSLLENIGQLGPNLWSFFHNVPLFHLRRSADWAGQHPVFTALLLAGGLVWWLRAPRRGAFAPGPTATRQLIAFGGLSLFLAIFPFAAAGKHFVANPVGQDSHHFFLIGLPASILLYAVVRGAICRRHRAHFGRVAVPLIGCGTIFLGSQLSDFYVAEQADWIFNRSLLRNAAKNEVARASSILGIQGFPFATQVAYGTYGFAGAFGDLTRLVTAMPPANLHFYTPIEIQRILLQTTILPNEFKRIDPSGQQAFLAGTCNRATISNWEIVRRFQTLNWFGTAAEMDAFLAPLSTVTATVLKPPTPITITQNQTVAASPHENHPSASADFTNAVGMQMVRVPWGWWAGKLEVTQAQYAALMFSNPSLFKDPNRPVECVSWHEATEFCRRLTEREAQTGNLPKGFVYRLPSVQEFSELLAGGSSEQAITSVNNLMWHSAPAGSLTANPLGLHDVVGNVWEWTMDWGDDAQRFKVSAGGAWLSQPWELAPYPGPRESLGTYQLAAIERLFGPLRRDYPDQGFWDRGFRCILAPAISATVVRQTKP